MPNANTNGTETITATSTVDRTNLFRSASEFLAHLPAPAPAPALEPTPEPEAQPEPEPATQPEQEEPPRRNRQYVMCSECGESIRRGDVWTIPDGTPVCNRCYRELVVPCGRCGRDILRINADHSTGLGALCSDCNVRRRRLTIMPSRSYRNTLGSARAFSLEIECIAHGNRTYYRHAHFQIKDDGSLNSGGVEYVFRALSGDAGLSVVRQGMKRIRENHSADGSCGYHVHIDARDLSALDLKRLLALAYLHERIVFGLLPFRRRNSNYTRPLGQIPFEVFLTALRQDELRYYLNHVDRYHALNMVALVKYGSVEFRHHTGTVDYQKIKHWLLLCLAMVEACRDPQRVATLLPDFPSGIYSVIPTIENLYRFLKFLRLPRRTIEFLAARWRYFEARRQANRSIAST